MVLPRTIRYSTIARVAFPALLVSLFVIIFSIVTMDLVLTMYQEIKAPHSNCQSEPQLIMDASVKRLTLEKKMLQSKLDELQTHINKKSSLLETNKYLRQENDNLAKKFHKCEAESWQQKRLQPFQTEQAGKIDNGDKDNNVIMHRDFFNYMAANLRDTPYPGVENYTRYTAARMGLLQFTDVKPLIPEFGPVINDVLSFQYPIAIRPCLVERFSSIHRTVFIVVNSAKDNFSKRKMIRQTWKNHLKEVEQEGLVRISGFAFTVGLTDDKETQSRIDDEAKTYGDIIQIGVSDLYDNLSLKVAGLFYWMHRNCAEVDFVLKVDDDVYVNVRNLAHFVQAHYQFNQSMYGLSSPRPDFWPQREGKWGISFEDWPWDNYPPSFNGPVVLFPSSVIFPLLAAFQTIPMMRFDDIYYTGICTEKTGIKIHFSSNSTISSVATDEMPSVPSPCDLRRFVAWVVNFDNEKEKHMNNSHVATGDFYRNVTQCIITDASGNSRTINPSDPVKFYFIENSKSI